MSNKTDFNTFHKLATLHDDVAQLNYDLTLTTYQELHDLILKHSGLSENKLKQFDSMTLASLSKQEFDSDTDNKAELLKQATNFNNVYLMNFARTLFKQIHTALYDMHLIKSRIIKSGMVIEENNQFILVKKYSKGTDDKYNTKRYKFETNEYVHMTNDGLELDLIKALAEIDKEYTRIKMVLGLPDKVVKSPNKESLNYQKALKDFMVKYSSVDSMKKLINDLCFHINYHETITNLEGEEMDKQISYLTFLSKKLNEFEYIKPYNYKTDYDEKVSFKPIMCQITDNFSDYENDIVAQENLEILKKRRRALSQKSESSYPSPYRPATRLKRALIGAENYPFIVEINQDKVILLDGFNRLFGTDLMNPEKEIIVKVYHDLSQKDYSNVLYCVNDWKTKGHDFSELFYDRGVRASLWVKYGLIVSPYAVSINIDTDTNLIKHVNEANKMMSLGTKQLTDVISFFNLVKENTNYSDDKIINLLIENKEKLFKSIQKVNELFQSPAREKVRKSFVDSLVS